MTTLIGSRFDSIAVDALDAQVIAATRAVHTAFTTARTVVALWVPAPMPAGWR